jgi:hypothetical protein
MPPMPPMPPILPLLLAAASIVVCNSPLFAEPAAPEGFRALFNGKDLTGWHGWNPHSTVKLQGDKLSEALKAQRSEFTSHWRVEDGERGHRPLRLHRGALRRY